MKLNFTRLRETVDAMSFIQFFIIPSYLLIILNKIYQVRNTLKFYWDIKIFISGLNNIIIIKIAAIKLIHLSYIVSDKTIAIQIGKFNDTSLFIVLIHVNIISCNVDDT